MQTSAVQQKMVYKCPYEQNDSPAAKYKKRLAVIADVMKDRLVLVSTKGEGGCTPEKSSSTLPLIFAGGGWLSSFCALASVSGESVKPQTLASTASVFRSAAPVVLPPASEPTKSHIPQITGLLALGGVACFATHAYLKQAQEVRDYITAAFDDIRGDGDAQQLQTLVDRAILAKDENQVMSRIFAYWNPVDMGRLEITLGILADSRNNFAVAQGHYAAALRYNIGDDLRDKLHFVYARSLRLAGAQANSQAARQHLDAVGQNSPVRPLCDIERQALDLGNDEIYDDRIPFDFKCVITQDIMVHPIYYVINEHRYIHEQADIEAWVQVHSNCPNTRAPLQTQDLQPDNEKRNAIQVWHSIKLK